MNDVLIPICEQHGANFQSAAGELSVTAAFHLVQRIREAGKPARLFYLSDYDSSRLSMPVAMARKIEYFIRRE